jgi:serine/threonine protein kinase
VVSGDDHGANDGFVVGFAAGSRIAGYRLEERIGQGGMAVVFRARDQRLGRLVALKILAPELAGDAEFQRRFTRESRAAAAIDDPHIVPVFAAGEADGMLFIAMRYVAGGDAHSLLNREGPLPPDRVADIISPVASALDAAHRAGLVHRDVKPSNMLMDVLPGRPDHVYLSDFGLSKAVASTSGMTRAGMVLGTLDYISPEQIAGKPVDGRADEYALACSAFELLAGGPPFRRDEPMAAMYAHLSESPPQLASRRPGLPPKVDGVLSKALAKAPGDRYASCGQFADALRDAFGFQPYRSGPRVMPAATPAPIESAWPAAQAATQSIDPAADMRVPEDAPALGYPARSYDQTPATPVGTIPPVITSAAPPTITPPLAQGPPSPPQGSRGVPTESGTGPGITSPAPGQRNRGPIIAAITVAAVVVLYFAIAAVAHTPPFTKSTPPRAGPTQSPTHAPTGTPSPSLPPGVAPLAQLLPSDIDDPAAQCQPHTPQFRVPGLIQALACIDPGLPGGNVYAYQANGPANYQTALLNFNTYYSFYVSTAGSSCPPAGSSQQAEGTTPWSDSYFPSRTGQVLECAVDNSQPTYIWTLPTEDAFIVAIGTTTFSALNSWWTKNQEPLNSPSPSAP